MNKTEYLRALAVLLSDPANITPEDASRSLDYYEEMIDDRMDDGMSEEEAVAAMGSPEDAARAIFAELDPEKPNANAEKPRNKGKLSPSAVVLLVLTSPVWLSLMVAVYVILWSLVITAWSVWVSLAGSALAFLVSAVIRFATLDFAQGLLFVGGTLFCAGAAVFLWFFALFVTRWIAKASAAIFRWFFSIFRSKEG